MQTIDAEIILEVEKKMGKRKIDFTVEAASSLLLIFRTIPLSLTFRQKYIPDTHFDFFLDIFILTSL